MNFSINNSYESKDLSLPMSKTKKTLKIYKAAQFMIKHYSNIHTFANNGILVILGKSQTYLNIHFYLFSVFFFFF